MSQFVLMADPPENDGQLHTLGLLEELRSECKALWGASSDAYFRVDGLLRKLANPNLHDIPRQPSLPSRAVGSPRPAHPVGHRSLMSVAIAHAALDTAKRCWRRCAGRVAGEQLGRRPASGLILEVDVGQRLPVGIADDS
jgi:hypothetical protein